MVEDRTICAGIILPLVLIILDLAFLEGSIFWFLILPFQEIFQLIWVGVSVTSSALLREFGVLGVIIIFVASALASAVIVMYTITGDGG